MDDEEEEYADKYLAAMHKVQAELFEICGYHPRRRKMSSVESIVWTELTHHLAQRISDRADKLNGITRKVE